MDISDVKYIVKAIVGDKGVGGVNEDGCCYYFNHIPKTGGTTLRYMLYEYFGGDNIYPNALDYFVKNKGAYLLWNELDLIKDSVIGRKRLLMGHYDMKPIPHFPVNPKVFSFFRNPIDCAISSINFNMIRGRRYSHMSLDEVIETELWREGSMQAKHMGYQRKQPNLDEVLRNVEGLDCIGIAEQFDRSISLLNKQFDWNLEIIKSKNVSKTKSSLTQEQVQRISKAIEIDQKVYNFALQLFNSRCDNLGL